MVRELFKDKPGKIRPARLTGRILKAGELGAGTLRKRTMRFKEMEIPTRSQDRLLRVVEYANETGETLRFIARQRENNYVFTTPEGKIVSRLVTSGSETTPYFNCPSVSSINTYDKERRQGGLGHFLLNWHLGQLQKRGVEKIGTNVSSSAEAGGFWHAEGATDREGNPLPKDREADGLIRIPPKTKQGSPLIDAMKRAGVHGILFSDKPNTLKLLLRRRIVSPEIVQSLKMSWVSSFRRAVANRAKKTTLASSGNVRGTAWSA